MRNHSYENDFDLHENETACRTHFHKKGFALRLALKQGHKRTRKWPISLPKTMLLDHSREILKVSFVHLLFSNKVAICISSRFNCRIIAFVICLTDFTAELLQVIYCVIKCEAVF